jgi:hypothetical protein
MAQINTQVRFCLSKTQIAILAPGLPSANAAANLGMPFAIFNDDGVDPH